ncbi:MAG: hypothetical protein U1C97_01120, partial [Candidatus Gracilibacteria bacterium]|nr:hypothetical protein [Candidatus Gracilibacteria bacterium]
MRLRGGPRGGPDAVGNAGGFLRLLPPHPDPLLKERGLSSLVRRGGLALRQLRLRKILHSLSSSPPTTYNLPPTTYHLKTYLPTSLQHIMTLFTSLSRPARKLSLILRSTWSYGRLVLLSTALMLLGWGSMHGAMAQTGQGTISLNPLIMEYQLQSGKSYERSIHISNLSSGDYQITFEAFDVQISRDHNVTFLPPESKGNVQRSLASWVRPAGDLTFTLPAGESRDFPCTIVVPEGVEVADYYASLNFYFSSPGSQFSAGAVFVRQSVGTLLLASVEDGGEGLHGVAPEVAEYQISKMILKDLGEETELSVDFISNALRYVSVQPLITITDESGEIYYKSGGKSKRIFPGEQATVSHRFPNQYLNA